MKSPTLKLDAWREDPALHCDHEQHAGEGWLHCWRCGATCTREGEKIVAFTRYAGGSNIERYDP